MLKAVFDSTVIVSAFLTPSGLAGELIKLAKAGEYNLILSSQIIDEARATLRTHKKLQKKYRYSDEEMAYFFSRLQNFATFVSELPEIRITDDSDDDFIIATAVKAAADYLVAWDNDLLTLGNYVDIQIITPKAFLLILRNQPQRQ